jgi:beta-glucosidase
VFVFTHDVLASVSRPLLQLAAFARQELAPGETGTVTLTVPAERLQFLGQDLRPLFESGSVEILVGPRADRAALLVGTVQLQARSG